MKSCDFVVLVMSDIERIKKAIAAFPDFPKEGILFRDIFPLFQDPDLVRATIHHMLYHIQQLYSEVDVIVGEYIDFVV